MIGFISNWVTHSHIITLTYKQYSTQTIRVLLNPTLKILLHYSTHKVFTSQVDELSSSLDFTYNSHSQATSIQELTSRGCLPPRTTCKGSDTRKTTVLLLLRHCGTRGGHLTPPYCCCCVIQRETCLPQRCVATFAARLSRRGKHWFLLLLLNRRVYRGAAYELPEPIQVC
jgi:hypothetical protein